jgi:ferritin-like metal-binding protein YciE
MTTDANENLNDWLRDAHAMEQQAEKMLTAQAERLEHYPALRGRIVQHIEETRWQQGVIDACITRRGTSNSVMKDIGGKLLAFGQAVGGMTASDEVGDTDTRTACEQILVQEKAMAAWLLEHMPQVTQMFLQRSATPGMEAKV